MRVVARFPGGFVLMAALLLFLVSTLAGLSGLRVNLTHSIRYGLYWKTPAPVTRGAYVMFCPPQLPVFEEARKRGYISAGLCPGNFSYMMKQVAGVAGDHVLISDAGVSINGRPWPHSRPLEVDPGQRRLPHLRRAFTVQDSRLFLMGQTDRSFDGRYFGPVAAAQVRDVIVPVLTRSPPDRIPAGG